MTAILRIDFESDPEDLTWYALLEKELMTLARTAGLEDMAAMAVLCAVVEAVNNIIEHAYEGEKGKPIKIAGTHEETSLKIELRDRGKPMPLPLPTGTPADVMATSGRGWQIIRAAFTQVSYERVNDENLLTLTRPLADALSDA
ncbi:MAG: ATP-binding protein [Thiohalocapsa sp.]|nr:ATP-binding protein [Thiohalocapsa sp.]MCF7991031.1 ATP-binding protein [Thiohalocapsa sp.]